MTRAFKIEKVYLKDKIIFQVLEVILLEQIEIYKTSQIGYDIITTCDSYDEAERIVKEILSNENQNQ